MTDKCNWCHDHGDFPRCGECGKSRYLVTLPPQPQPPCDDTSASQPYEFWVVLDKDGSPLLDADSDNGSVECGQETRLFAYRSPTDVISQSFSGGWNDESVSWNHSFDVFNLCYRFRLEELIASIAYVVRMHKEGLSGSDLGIEKAEEQLKIFMERGRLK